METISIEILNPKAMQLLQDLADLNLITIKPKPTLKSLLEKMRQDSDQIPSLEEIASEVKQVRQARNAEKA
ncbi:MAG: hypothetical protein ACOYN4_17970, partial [Bacteroidales bacterium]